MRDLGYPGRLFCQEVQCGIDTWFQARQHLGSDVLYGDDAKGDEVSAEVFSCLYLDIDLYRFICPFRVLCHRLCQREIL